jgi:radical SAM superfamily enzyme YgiQ (UPF0313 family)
MAPLVLFLVKNLYTMERLGVMQLSALAVSKGWDTDLLIADAMDFDRLLDGVQRRNPAVVAMSVMSPEYPQMREIARRIYESTGVFILMGGPHATFFPDIIEEPFIQAVAFGEGDTSFPEFLACFARGEDYRRVPGMHFRSAGSLIRNAPAPLVEDLDTLPFPDRRIMAKGNALLAANPTHIFMASRGCPNACTYCFNHTYNQMFRSCGTLFRRRSVDHLLREMEAVKAEFGLRFAYIDDDIFTFCPPEWLEEFAREYPRRVGVPFMVNIHANFVDEPKIKLLHDAGCTVICFGIECGDPQVAARLLKRHITREKFLDLSRLLHRYGIRFMTQNILALPVEHPLAVDLQTLHLNIACRPHYAVAHLFFPLPGTELARHAAAGGFIDGSADRLPERTNSYSALQFADPREKTRVERLHKLFGLVVSFPWLRPALPVLLRLPLGPAYALLFMGWYGFSMRFRLEKTRKSRAEILFFLKSLLQSLTSFLRRQPERT